MFANLRDHMPRQVFETNFEDLNFVVAPEWAAQNLGNECVDESIALLRRHVVLNRDQALLAVDDRLSDMAVEIRGEEQTIIDVDDGIAIKVDMRADVSCGRETSDRVPEFG
jgi:hypothetical protein